MKKSLLLSLLFFKIITSFGQLEDSFYTLTFDNPNEMQHLKIDTILNPNNIWQVGTPHKIYFTNAFSSPKAIVTDTINSYPINDTSTFIITNVAFGQGFEWPHTVILSGQYYVNSDTLNDFGNIEFSPDNGTTWIDLINDTLYTDAIWWYSPKPTLTGNSNDWKNFYVNIAQLGPIFNIHDGDTILYRFTFISDSIQTNKDGLMFDDFHFEDWVENIQEIHNNNFVLIYPNPTTDLLTIHKTKKSDSQSIQILNITGQVLYNNQNFVGETIDTRQYENGVYILRYSDTKNISNIKFLINR